MNTSVYENPIDTAQALIDNTMIPATIYQDGDRIVYVNGKMPKRLLHEDGSVKVTRGKVLLWDEEEKRVITRGVDKVLDWMEGVLCFDYDMNCTPEQETQVRKWFDSLMEVK